MQSDVHWNSAEDHSRIKYFSDLPLKTTQNTSIHMYYTYDLFFRNKMTPEFRPLWHLTQLSGLYILRVPLYCIFQQRPPNFLDFCDFLTPRLWFS